MGGGEDPKSPNGETALVLASQYLMLSFSAYSSLLCKPPPLKTLITAVCTLPREGNTSQLGDLPLGAIFSNSPQGRSWKS